MTIKVVLPLLQEYLLFWLYRYSLDGGFSAICWFFWC